MAAVSLFWDNNMAAVTSCENALLTGSLSNDDGDVKENVKKAIGLDNQKSTNLRAKRAEV